MKNILTKLMPVVKVNNGTIIFSVFISDVCTYEIPGIYGFENAYARSYFTLEQLDSIQKLFNIDITQEEPFFAQGENLHRIFRIRNKN
jgi:hypothetical protein